MTRKLPESAFDEYVRAGTTRSYRAIAEQYGVTKKAVVLRAKAERWQERLAEIESKARLRADEDLVDVVGEMNERHVKTLRAIQGRALQVLSAMPLDNAMNAVRALGLAIKAEREILAPRRERDADRVTIEDLVAGVGEP